MNSWIAQNRFGLGIPLHEVNIGNPRDWLFDQLSPTHALPSSIKSWKSSASIVNQTIRTTKSMRKMSKKERKIESRNEISNILWQGHTTQTPFFERVVMFFCNHLTVSAEKNSVAQFIPSFYKEVVRSNMHRGYAAMLIASTKHPAMLKYLDNIRSFGPDSKIGTRRNVGLNENLAREILELHTVGLESRYTQKDVVAFSNILTGWSVPRNKKEWTGSSFHFRESGHQPGAQTVMGKRYTQKGVRKGEALLSDLARSPYTAHRLAQKILKHFICESPDQLLVNKMAKAYLDGNDDIIAMLKVMILDQKSWEPRQQKVKRPDELVLSTMRLLIPSGSKIQKKEQKQLHGNLTVMGQKPFHAPSPKGWSDEAMEWLSGEAMLRRLRFAEQVASHYVSQHPDIMRLAEHSLGPVLSKRTRMFIARAPSRKTALALLLSAPEFQRR